MKDLAKRYMDEHARPKKKPRSIESDATMWRRHVIPAFGKMPVSEVTMEDVAKLHHRLRHTPYAANRVLALLSKAFNLAEKWSWRPRGSNPVAGIDRYREERRERLMSSKEMERLGQTLEEMYESGEVTPWVVAAVRLLLLTGCRKNEILRLRWDEVDLEHKVLRLKDSKTGKKKVPLSGAAIEVLQALPRVDGNPHVIVGSKPGSYLIGFHRIWNRIRSRAGLPDLRVHDLRHHFASMGALAGVSMPMLGAMLGGRPSRPPRPRSR